MTDEAFDRIVELTVKACDLRFSIYLLRMAGIEAESRASRKVEVKDVEMVYEGGTKVFLVKSISALNSDERETLKIIYSLKGERFIGRSLQNPEIRGEHELHPLLRDHKQAGKTQAD